MKAFEAACARWAGRARGQRSIEAVVGAVKAALGAGFAAAVAHDFETFVALRASDQSAALRYLFFAERQASRIPGVDPKSAKRVASVGIAGAGTMGRGIAAACLNVPRLELPRVSSASAARSSGMKVRSKKNSRGLPPPLRSRRSAVAI
jgi:3-hydroxyacyl-CoA dehydrogenase